MTDPRPFSLGCLDWSIFRVPAPITYTRDQAGRYIRSQNDNYEILEWLNANMQGEWTWGESQGSNTWPIYIKNKGDALLFKLTWFDSTVKPVFYS